MVGQSSRITWPRGQHAGVKGSQTVSNGLTAVQSLEGKLVRNQGRVRAPGTCSRCELPLAALPRGN